VLDAHQCEAFGKHGGERRSSGGGRKKKLDKVGMQLVHHGFIKVPQAPIAILLTMCTTAESRGTPFDHQDKRPSEAIRVMWQGTVWGDGWCPANPR